jgi:hypothetical protein
MVCNKLSCGPQAFKPFQQIRVHARDALLDLLDVLHDLIGHEAVHGAELLGVQGLEQLLAARPQTPLAVQHLVHGLVGDQRLDHGARAGAVNVGHHHVDAHACIHQHLVQPVLLGAAHAHQLLALARHQAKLPHLQRRDERRPQQTGPRQRGQPLRVGHVGLATGHGFDVPRVDHPRVMPTDSSAANGLFQYTPVLSMTTTSGLISNAHCARRGGRV